MLATLWSSSAAMTAIIDTLNAAYDIEEGRPWWKVRITAIGLTVGVALFILVSLTLVLAGPRLAELIADYTVLGPAFEWTWKVLQWPLVFALVSGGVALIYYFAPDAIQDWVWLTPGSLFATTVWLISSLGFKYYVANMGAYVETYGAIGGVMVLMLWFYISGLAILLGAEMNAEIEHASPYGKDEGEKVPGQKRMIGAARMRQWMARQRQRVQGKAGAPSGSAPPSAEELQKTVGPPPPDKEPGAPTSDPRARDVAAPLPSPAPAYAQRHDAHASDYVIGAGVVVAQLWYTIKSFRQRKRA
jgi:membrane protein